MNPEVGNPERPLAGLLTMLSALRRRLGIVAICVVLVPAAAVAYSLHQPKIYDASASLLFRNPQFDQQLLGSAAFQQTLDPVAEQATNIQLVELPVVAQRTAAVVRGGLTQSQVASEVAVTSSGQANIGVVTASDEKPQRAAQIANVYAAQYVIFRRDADRAKITSAISLIQSELRALPRIDISQRQALQHSISQLQVIDAVQTGNAEVVQPAQAPRSASSPKPLRNGILGGVLGVLLGVALALLLERLDRRLKDLDAVSAAFGKPILAVVPQSAAMRRKGGESVSSLGALPAADAEAFRMLRVALRYFNVDERVHSVVVTSSAQGDGKSTVAMYLAMAAADAGMRTLLLEADLRHPTIGAHLGISGHAGLSLVLAGEANLADATNRVSPITGEHVSEGDRALDVIVAGPVPPNPADLIDSNRMREIMRQAKSEYDLVVVDTPPTSVVSDAVPLLKEVSGVVVVSRADKTTRESAQTLRRQLENVGAHVLGVVVNSVRREGASGYYYSYGYGYLSSTKPATTTMAPQPGDAVIDSANGKFSESGDLAQDGRSGRVLSTIAPDQDGRSGPAETSGDQSLRSELDGHVPGSRRGGLLRWGRRQ